MIKTHQYNFPENYFRLKYARIHYFLDRLLQEEMNRGQKSSRALLSMRTKRLHPMKVMGSKGRSR